MCGDGSVGYGAWRDYPGFAGYASEVGGVYYYHVCGLEVSDGARVTLRHGLGLQEKDVAGELSFEQFEDSETDHVVAPYGAANADDHYTPPSHSEECLKLRPERHNG